MQPAQPDPVDVEVVRHQFYANGITVKDWAREHGFDVNMVYNVLNGRSRARRGQSHQIALALGLKKIEPGVLLAVASSVEHVPAAVPPLTPKEAQMKT